MNYADAIAANLPRITPKGMQVHLVQLTRQSVTFRITRTGKPSFRWRSDNPSVFSYAENEVGLLRSFDDMAKLYDQWPRRSVASR
jgi:hypothetical protein